MVPPRAVKFASNCFEQLRQAGHDGFLDRPAGVAQLLPVGEFGHDAEPLVPDGAGGVAEVGPQLGVAELAVGGFREGLVFVQVAGAEDGQGRHPQECAAHRAVLPVVRRTSPVTAAGFSSGAGQDLGEVQRGDAAALPGQAAADVHQAGRVAAGAQLGAGAADVGGLVREHRRGDVRVLHREGAAEAAALVGLGQLGQFDAADRAQQVQLPVAEPEQAHAVAAGVVGDPVREVGAQLRRRRR